MKFQRAILHCADTPDYAPGHPLYNKITREDFHKWHVEENGWSDVGYHQIVYQDGTLVAGRPMDRMGAHTRGHNRGSLGVCYVGSSKPNPLQIATLISLANLFKSQYDIDCHDWYGHYEFTKAKTCPGVSMDLFRIMLQGHMGC